MHPGQLSVSTASVRTLVALQFPQWRHLHVEAVSSAATVHATFRIGDQFVARCALVPDDDVVKCGGANQSYLWFTRVRGWNHFNGYLGSKDSGIIRHHC